MAGAGVAAVNLGQLAQLYRAQVLEAPGAPGGLGGLGGLGATAARGLDFGHVVKSALSNLEGLDRTAQTKAIDAATGDLTDVHDYVIAATKAQTATELTTTVRNKALEAFNEIMRMPL